MDVLGWLALVMLSLVGYSAGAVLGGRLRSSPNPSPTLLDTLMVAVIWVGAIMSRLSWLGRWTAVGVWFVGALSMAFVVNLLQKQTGQGKSISQ